MPNQFLIDSYNSYLNELYSSWSDSLSLFYAQSTRKDSQYWKEINSKKFDYDAIYLQKKYNYYGIKDFSERLIKDHGSKAYDIYTAISYGTNFSMNVDPVVLDRWSYWDRNNYKSMAENYKKIFDERKLQWSKNTEEELHIYDYMVVNNLL